MSLNIRWVREDDGPGACTSGWAAWSGYRYLGFVFLDGDAAFGEYDHSGHRIKEFGSHAIAAQALVSYVEAGGR